MFFKTLSFSPKGIHRCSPQRRRRRDLGRCGGSVSPDARCAAPSLAGEPSSHPRHQQDRSPDRGTAAYACGGPAAPAAAAGACERCRRRTVRRQSKCRAVVSHFSS